MQHLAVYLRVSSKKQDTKSQEPDVKRWVSAYANGTPVRYYRDKATGKTMNRPGWKRLEDALATGAVEKIVCWRLGRLGRTASGLTALFESLQQRGIGLVSIKDSLDLSTAAGRLMANVLASVAAYETEIRGERIAAGQSVARANGKKWGGSKKGRRVKVSNEKIEIIRRLRQEGKPIAAVARAVGVSRPTVYSVLADDVA